MDIMFNGLRIMRFPKLYRPTITGEKIIEKTSTIRFCVMTVNMALQVAYSGNCIYSTATAFIDLLFSDLLISAKWKRSGDRIIIANDTMKPVIVPNIRPPAVAPAKRAIAIFATEAEAASPILANAIERNPFWRMCNDFTILKMPTSNNPAGTQYNHDMVYAPFRSDSNLPEKANISDVESKAITRRIINDRNAILYALELFLGKMIARS